MGCIEVNGTNLFESVIPIWLLCNGLRTPIPSHHCEYKNGFERGRQVSYLLQHHSQSYSSKARPTKCYIPQVIRWNRDRICKVDLQGFLPTFGLISLFEDKLWQKDEISAKTSIDLLTAAKHFPINFTLFNQRMAPSPVRCTEEGDLQPLPRVGQNHIRPQYVIHAE